MLNALRARLRQKYRTYDYPAKAPVLPDLYRGRPGIDANKCPAGCMTCREACPVGAIDLLEGKPAIDLGRCIFCTACLEACEPGAIVFSRDWRQAGRDREDLVVRAGNGEPGDIPDARHEIAARLFRRSLKLRQVSAGGCNACEADINVLGTLTFDLGRFGIQIVASPRHADGLIITGPVPENMRLALRKTYDAVPDPKIVIAVGACAISGGIYRGHPDVHDGAGGIVPVDLYIPGCPPNPWTILDGLLRFLGR